MANGPPDLKTFLPPKPRAAMNLINAHHQDARRYNPERDLAAAYPKIMRAVMEHLTPGEANPQLVEMLRRAHVSGEALTQAVAAYCNLCAAVVDDQTRGQPPEVTADKVGLSKCDVAAQYILYAHIGMAVTGFFHDFYNDAFIGSKSILTGNSVRELAEKFLAAQRTVGVRKDNE